MNEQVRRRAFLHGLAGAGTIAAVAAPAQSTRRNPSDVLGVASIGLGTQGYRLLTYAQAVPNTEIRVLCDLYEGNIQRAKKLCTNPKVRVERDWEKAIADPNIDIVLIATPDFWHAPMTVRAAQEKKSIYIEKAWCMRLDEAKAMRKAVKENDVVMQLGHHYNSSPYYRRAREIYRSGQLGTVSLVRTYIDRTNPYPVWKFYTDYNITEMPRDASPETIDWERFIRNASKRPFDAERFFTWRFWWEYGTGIAGDVMCHVWDGVNMIMGMGIPEAVLTHGGDYFWKNPRDVPDMWNVVFDYPKQNLAVTYSSTHSSKHVGEITELLGRDQTLEVSPRFCRTFGAEWKPGYEEKAQEAQRTAQRLGLKPADAAVAPDYSMGPDDLKLSSHMEDFIDCVRNHKQPRCDVDRAFEEAVAVIMSVESFRKERKVRWDAAREEIV